AIAACPAADVIFVAHAGLDQLVSVADVWRSLPMDQVVRARWWRVPVGGVARGARYESQGQWLYDRGHGLGTWVTHEQPARRPGPGPVPRPGGGITRPGATWPPPGPRRPATRRCHGASSGRTARSAARSRPPRRPS